MKLKVLFALLNIILAAACVLSFSLLFAVFSAPREVSAAASGFPPGVFVLAACCTLFFALLVAVDVFFIRHMRVFEFLAAENWPALARTLETETLIRGRLSRMNAALLTEVLVLLSDYETLRRLFAKLKSEKPALYRRLAPDFAAASIVFGNLEEAESCVRYARDQEDRRSSGKTAAAWWLDFYAAFIAMRKKEFVKALDGFAAVATESEDLLVAAVSGYLCSEVIPGKTFGIGVGDSEKKASFAAAAARSRVLKSCSLEKWNKKCAAARKKVRAAVIGKTIADVRAWLFPPVSG